ncbi:ferrous iron transport protein B [Brevundimonas bullata]|uniref:Fe(2+) transporter FeoB n=1 Tax=Brevundimonas bullata TaxID=13160 RepID=A0A7W7N5H9_9CAUL|nr:ferrous iron transporter B [Brevundimonas bullata]MBB4799381.1 ferrous iron transport protein B [Brevundimonas bullata]MBB6384547.1 ferrous iron transport protein B [Brevundimonas bullata]
MDMAVRTARIALVGNPNSGKTALFNALTGAHQKVANYAGVTVERKEGRIHAADGRTLSVLDLPGTYSLRARSLDEEVTRDAVLGALPGETPPDVVVCVADATNLRLVLRLALELKQVGRPMVLALNMYDIAQRQGLRIDLERLSAEIGAPVVTTVATRKRGIAELVAAAQTQADLAVGETHSEWHAPSATEIRAAHREAERIMKACVRAPERPDTLTGKIDSVLLHPLAGLAILLGVLFVMFQAVFTWATPAMDGIEALFALVGGWVAAVVPDGLLQSLIVDGLIGGVGSVLVFLPQILIIFFFIIVLEDFGYMARAAFLMDKIMGGAGLHGRAFIPLLSSFACAIPGIMATRVIEAKRDRLTTILIAPLMTCSARIPVYVLIIAAFIPNETVWGFVSLQGLVMFGLYAAGIISALLVSVVIRKVFWRGAVEPFMMELPAYKMPDIKSVLFNLWLRAKIFMRRAGKIILPLMIIVWALSTFPYPPEGATGPAIDYSFAGMIGKTLEPIFAPIGFSWQMVVALVPGMAAREVAVAVLGTVYAVAGAEENVGALASVLSADWSLATGLAFLAWYVFAPQCLPTIGVVRRETGSMKWTLIMVGYMFGLAYLGAFIVYHTAVALGGG